MHVFGASSRDITHFEKVTGAIFVKLETDTLQIAVIIIIAFQYDYLTLYKGIKVEVKVTI